MEPYRSQPKTKLRFLYEEYFILKKNVDKCKKGRELIEITIKDIVREIRNIHKRQLHHYFYFPDGHKIEICGEDVVYDCDDTFGGIRKLDIGPVSQYTSEEIDEIMVLLWIPYHWRDYSPTGQVYSKSIFKKVLHGHWIIYHEEAVDC